MNSLPSKSLPNSFPNSIPISFFLLYLSWWISGCKTPSLEYTQKVAALTKGNLPAKRVSAKLSGSIKLFVLGSACKHCKQTPFSLDNSRALQTGQQFGKKRFDNSSKRVFMFIQSSGISPRHSRILGIENPLLRANRMTLPRFSYSVFPFTDFSFFSNNGFNG